MSQMHNPCHPSEVLKEALSEISVTDAAKDWAWAALLSAPVEWCHRHQPGDGHAPSKALGTSPEFWYGMQVNGDTWLKKKFRGRVRPIIQRETAAA